MNWEVIIKWLPRLTEGALLTLELVAIAVLAGLLLWGAYLLVEQVIANADRRLQLLAARQAQSSR